MLQIGFSLIVSGLTLVSRASNIFHLLEQTFHFWSIGEVSVLMRVDIEVAFQLHLDLYLFFWVNTEHTIFVPALKTISLVPGVTLALEDLGVFAKAPLEHALSIDITVGNVATVTKNTVTVFLVLSSLAPTTLSSLWSSSLAWSTLVPIVRTPGTVSTGVVPEAGVSLLREGVLVVTDTGASHSVALLVAVVMHGETALHGLVILATGTSSLLGDVPPAWTAYCCINKFIFLPVYL